MRPTIPSPLPTRRDPAGRPDRSNPDEPRPLRGGLMSFRSFRRQSGSWPPEPPNGGSVRPAATERCGVDRAEEMAGRFDRGSGRTTKPTTQARSPAPRKPGLMSFRAFLRTSLRCLAESKSGHDPGLDRFELGVRD
jgi:hypothetical protein